MDVYTYELWAQSLTDKGFGTEVPVKENVTRYKTVYLSNRRYGRDATAQICLSRLDGAGSARAIVSSYSFYSRATPDPLYVFPGAYSGPTDTLAILLAGPSSVTVGSARSITFMLGVSNMFAYATATIFAEPANLLDGIVKAVADALRVFPRLAGAQAADPRAAGAMTHLVYDRRTGDVLEQHDAVAVPGVRLPESAELARISAELARRAGGASEHLEITAVPSHLLTSGDNAVSRRVPPDLRRPAS